MRLKLGNWAGGAEGVPEGTVAWAGGKTDFSKGKICRVPKEVSHTLLTHLIGPFDMYVQDVSIQNYNPADSYEYSDKSGSWQSIKINKEDGSSSNSGGSAPSSGSSTTTSISTSASSAPSTTGANSTSTEKPEEQQQSNSSSSAPASSAPPTTTAEATKLVYTSQASVEPIDQHTEAAVSVTQTGSMYSTNTASASALNSAISAASTLETAVTASTRVPDSKPSGNGSWTSSAAAAEQTANAGVSLKGSVAAGSIVGLALGVILF
jgi:hypothetical protein